MFPLVRFIQKKFRVVIAIVCNVNWTLMMIRFFYNLQILWTYLFLYSILLREHVVAICVLIHRLTCLFCKSQNFSLKKLELFITWQLQFGKVSSNSMCIIMYKVWNRNQNYVVNYNKAWNVQYRQLIMSDLQYFKMLL